MNHLSEILKSSKFASTSSQQSNTFHSKSDLPDSDMWLDDMEDINDRVSFEQKFCSNFFCCNMWLPGMHELLEHVEEVHIVSPLASSFPVVANSRPSEGSNSIRQPLPSSTYGIICAYPEPSTPPSLSRLFENEFDWTSSVYPGSQPNSPLMDYFPGVQELPTLEDSMNLGFLAAHGEDVSPDIPMSASQTSHDSHPKCASAGDQSTATIGVIVCPDNPDSTLRDSAERASAIGNSSCSASTTIPLAEPVQAIPYGGLHSASYSHLVNMNSVHLGAYSQHDPYMPTHISPAEALKSPPSEKTPSSGPSRRGRTKVSQKASPTSVSASSSFTLSGFDGKLSAGRSTKSRDLKGTRGELDDGDDLGNVEMAEKVLRRTRIPRKEKKHRCPMPGCSKAYLNPNGLKYHIEKGTCKIEPLEGDDSESPVDPTLAGCDAIAIQDMDTESMLSPVNPQVSKSNSNSVPSMDCLPEPSTSSEVINQVGASSSVDIQDQIVHSKTQTHNILPISLSSASTVLSQPLTLLTSSLTTQLTTSPSPIIPDSGTPPFADPYVTHEHPQQVAGVSTDTSDSSSSDEEEEEVATVTRDEMTSVAGVKQLYMPIPQVANVWRVKPFRHMSE